MTPPMPAEVDAAFAAIPRAERSRLLEVRDSIFAVAAATDGVGPLTETLKWGEPSYVTAASRSGSTIRLAVERSSGDAAVHFICHTRLVDEFRRLYPETFRYVGNRSIIVGEDAADRPELRHCLALALTYHRRKTPAGRQ